MNWVDVVIILTFLIYLFEGVRRGFVEQTLELIGFFLTIFVAYWSYQPIANWLIPHIGISQIEATPIAFLLDWIVLQALYSLGLHFIYPLFPKALRRNPINQIAGLLPAFLKGYVIVALIITLIIVLPTTATLKSQINDSHFGNYFIGQSDEVENYLNRVFGRNVQQSLTFLTVPSQQNEEIIQPNEKIYLGFKTTDVKIDYVAEQQMFQQVNQARAQNGLPALVWDDNLANVARAHSADMFAQGYFSHIDNNGGTPFDRMTAAGIKYTAAGENIAFAANESAAFTGLMNSPGHRANILEKAFGHVGIGVVDSPVYGEMFTQDFTN